MAIRLSTGLRNHLCVTGSLSGALTGAVLRIYSGSAPLSANSEVPGSSELLCEVSTDGTGDGLNWEATSNAGVLAKDAGDEWTGQVLEDGTAGFYRLVMPADDGSQSTTAIRVQGTIATINADLLISSPSLTQGAAQRIGEFFLTVPAE